MFAFGRRLSLTRAILPTQLPGNQSIPCGDFRVSACPTLCGSRISRPAAQPPGAFLESLDPLRALDALRLWQPRQ